MPVTYTFSWFSDFRFISGLTLFIVGFIVNIYSDNLLLRLRQKNGTQYSIPQGGLFRYISCPNFLGEIIEWAGFALLTWSLPGLSFFIWTAVNLIPRALDHHKWYKSHFDEYPEKRKAILPWLI
jgi:steroid 5-alpha reductase family enzyme